MKTALPTIDVCICTFNRVDYLRQCIDLLLPQVKDKGIIIHIIDNCSSDQTADYVHQLETERHPVQYHLEPLQGVSHARNRAWKTLESDWIFYIDDECLPGPGLIDQALEHIQRYDRVAAIGGPIIAVYHGVKPSWVPEGFGEFKLPNDTFTEISKGYLRCGCFLVQRKVLAQLGGFSTDLGMKGYALAYGEELELQDRMRAAGYIIAYAPTLKIAHQVRPEKLNVRWMLQAEFARRRDKMTFAPVSKRKAIMGFMRTVGGRLVHLPAYLYRVSFDKDYPLKLCVFEWLRPLMYHAGEMKGVFLKKPVFR